jgi:hypothetical protein
MGQTALKFIESKNGYIATGIDKKGGIFTSASLAVTREVV